MRNALLVLIPLGCSPLPAHAQHMNAAGAPCQQPNTNAETSRCFEAAYQQVDLDLNRTYGQVQKGLQTQKGLRASDQGRLQTAERLWIQYREATCTAAYDLYGGASGGPAEHFACLEAQTRLRLAELNTTYGWLIQKAAK